MTDDDTDDNDDDRMPRDLVTDPGERRDWLDKCRINKLKVVFDHMIFIMIFIIIFVMIFMMIMIMLILMVIMIFITMVMVVVILMKMQKKFKLLQVQSQQFGNKS